MISMLFTPTECFYLREEKHQEDGENNLLQSFIIYILHQILLPWSNAVVWQGHSIHIVGGDNIYIYIYLGNWSEETTLVYLDADWKLIRKWDFKK
jgi:hypothetical protein